MEFLRKVEWRKILKSYGKLRVNKFLGFFQLETGGRMTKETFSKFKFSYFHF